MLARLATAALVGLTAHPVGVEVDIGRGLPAVTVVGLGGTAVLEARDRLRAAFGNTGYEWPDRRITVSLPPADLPKQGSGFDLAKVNLSHAKMRGMETSRRRRAAIYTRISQDREGAGLGVERQEADCRALAEQLGWTIVAVHSDNDLSAYSGKPRPGYAALLADLRAGTADAVICWHTDRLHRRPVELEEYIAVCEPLGVPTMTVKAGPVDLATPAGRMVARQLGAVGRYEVEHMIERQQRARLQAATAGRWGGGRRPFGYEADGVTVVKAEADALRWAAAQVLAGASLSGIAAELNRRGVRTATGKQWRSTELRRALLRPRNAGLMVHRGQVVGEAGWPAILDSDTWRGVVAVLGDPARRTNTTVVRRWLLSGLAVCGVCGDPVRSFSASARRRKTKPVYTCRTGKHVIRDAAQVDAFVEAVIVERLSRPDARELLVADRRADTTNLHLRDAALRERLDELGRLYGEGAVDAPQLQAATAAIRAQREQITAQLAAASRGSVLAGVVDAPDPAAVWAGLDLSRRRAIVDVLATVTILPARKGRRPGWRSGESYFDPATVRVEPKRA
jgi:site-specific DNA recombinase